MSDTLVSATGIESKPVTMAQAIADTLMGAMHADPKLLVLGEDIADPIGGVWKTYKGLSTAHGVDRVRATPIAEEAIMGCAVGAALGGYRVVADIMFFDFMTAALDQLVNHAAKFRYTTGGRTPVAMTVCTTVGGGNFGAQHMQSLEAWLMHVPGLNVVYPSNPHDARGLLNACLKAGDPCVFIQHTGLLYSEKQQLPLEEYVVDIGQARVATSGSDVTFISYGPSMIQALKAADQLATEGISAEVIDLRTLAPLDLETILASVRKTRRAVVVHSATQFCGAGAEIAASLAEHLPHHLDAPVVRLGAQYTPLSFAPGLNTIPDAAAIADAGRRLAQSPQRR